jgi:hypothetical protein
VKTGLLPSTEINVAVALMRHVVAAALFEGFYDLCHNCPNFANTYKTINPNPPLCGFSFAYNLSLQWLFCFVLGFHCLTLENGLKGACIAFNRHILAQSADGFVQGINF